MAKQIIPVRIADRKAVTDYDRWRERVFGDKPTAYAIPNRVLRNYLDTMRNLIREAPGMGCMVITIGKQPISKPIMRAITDSMPETTVVRVTGNRWKEEMI